MKTAVDATLAFAAAVATAAWYAGRKKLARLNADFGKQLQAVSYTLQASNHSLSRALEAADDMVSHTMRLQEVTAALSQAQTEDEVADVVLSMGLGVVESIRGVVVRVEGQRFEVLRARGYPPGVEARLREVTADSNNPILVAVTSGEPVWSESADEQHPRFPFVPEQRGVPVTQASVAVPLRHRGETVGALVMIFADGSAFGAAQKAFTLLLAQAAANALFRARSYDVERAARQGAETLALARADVLGIVAHDLRNPLGLIVASSSSLLELENQSPAQRRKMLEIMQRAARRMDRLIGDLLDATRLQAGRLSLDLADVDAARVVHEADEAFVAAAAERRIDWSAQVPEHECWVRADEGRLLQAIGNLVGNALKFTAEGGHVTLSASRRGSEVIFSVSDTGPGIPSELQAHLFDTFWQARHDDRRGVGLGLSITKGIVGALGGRLWVESAVGVGSKFSFALSAASDAATARRAANGSRVEALS